MEEVEVKDLLRGVTGVCVQRKELGNCGTVCMRTASTIPATPSLPDFLSTRLPADFSLPMIRLLSLSPNFPVPMHSAETLFPIMSMQLIVSYQVQGFMFLLCDK